jgi:hypothetical protein
VDPSWLKGLPRLALDLERAGSRLPARKGRTVLLATELSRPDLVALKQRRAKVTEVSTLQAAFDQIEKNDFEIVVLGMARDLTDYAFARAIKRDEPVVDPRLEWLAPFSTRLEAIRKRYFETPFLLVPREPGKAYLVVVGPPRDYQQDPELIPVSSAILFLDFAGFPRTDRRVN